MTSFRGRSRFEWEGLSLCYFFQQLECQECFLNISVYKMKLVSVGLAPRSPRGISSTHYPKMRNNNSWGRGSQRFAFPARQVHWRLGLSRAELLLCHGALCYFWLWHRIKGCADFLCWFLPHTLSPLHTISTVPSAWFRLTVSYRGIDLFMIHVARDAF